MHKYKHHNSCFLISTSNIKNDRLRECVNIVITDFFTGFIESDSNDIQFSFCFTDNIETFVTDSDFVRFKDIKVGDSQTHFKDNELNFLINKDDPFKVIVNIKENNSFKSSFRIFNKGFMSNIERQVSVFYYRLFILFSQLWNTKNELSYIHSSAVTVGGSAILFTADSGVGKSSLLIKLSQLKEFAFVSDDLSIISSNSKVFYNGRRLSVKPYHLRNFSFLAIKLKSLMHYGQKLQWKLLRDNRLMYRIPPSDLFAKITESSDLKRVIHLCNHSSQDFIISNLKETDLIKYSTTILTNELFLANYKLNKLASLPNSSFDNSSTLYKRVSEIYSGAFKNVEIKLVLVPYKSNANDLYEFLKFEGCLA